MKAVVAGAVLIDTTIPEEVAINPLTETVMSEKEENTLIMMIQAELLSRVIQKGNLSHTMIFFEESDITIPKIN